MRRGLGAVDTPHPQGELWAYLSGGSPLEGSEQVDVIDLAKLGKQPLNVVLAHRAQDLRKEQLRKARGSAAMERRVMAR